MATTKSKAIVEAANALVMLLGPIHPTNPSHPGHPNHPILYPNLCLYLHPSLLISLMDVHLLDLSISEGV